MCRPLPTPCRRLRQPEVSAGRVRTARQRRPPKCLPTLPLEGDAADCAVAAPAKPAQPSPTRNAARAPIRRPPPPPPRQPPRFSQRPSHGDIRVRRVPEMGGGGGGGGPALLRGGEGGGGGLRPCSEGEGGGVVVRQERLSHVLQREAHSGPACRAPPAEDPPHGGFQPGDLLQALTPGHPERGWWWAAGTGAPGRNACDPATLPGPAR